MRIALKELEQIIREELTQLLSEQYTRSDIRNMTPQQAQRAAAQLNRDTGGNFDYEMMTDLTQRSLNIGGISSLDPGSFDPITKGVAAAREAFPRVSKFADAALGFVPGVGTGISVADLRADDTDYGDKPQAATDLKTSMALDLIPGGSALKGPVKTGARVARGAKALTKAGRGLTGADAIKKVTRTSPGESPALAASTPRPSALGVFGRGRIMEEDKED
jgi:hypothetical protein